MNVHTVPSYTHSTSAIFYLQTGPTNYGLPLQPYVKGQFKVEAKSATRVAGNKDYELTDHFGNLRATISDRRIPEVSSGSGNRLIDAGAGRAGAGTA